MLVALVLVGVAGVAAAAQERAARVREVAIALVDVLSKPGLRAEILRFADPKRRDLILLPREATADTLALALAWLGEAGTWVPARAGQVGRFGVTETRPLGAMDARLRAQAARALTRLRRERPSQIGRYGRGRWMTIRLPAG